MPYYPPASTGTVTSVAVAAPLLGGGPITGSGTVTTPIASLNDFRLTLDSTNAVSTANQTAKGTIYLSPWTRGNLISTYDSSIWTPHSTGQLSVALANVVSGKVYDVFLFNNAGTLTLVFGPAWTNTTTRASSPGGIQQQDGVWVNTSTFTDVITGSISVTALNGRLLGSVYAMATNQLEDSATNRNVANVENRVKRYMFSREGSTSWAYNSATLREINGGSTLGTSRFSYLDPLGDVLLRADAHAIIVAGAVSIGFSAGIGIDSSTVDSSLTRGGPATANNNATPEAIYEGYPGLGYHTIRQLEADTGAATIYSQGQSTEYYTGMTGEVWL